MARDGGPFFGITLSGLEMEENSFYASARAALGSSHPQTGNAIPASDMEAVR
jgi:hypothetical protein